MNISTGSLVLLFSYALSTLPEAYSLRAPDAKHRELQNGFGHFDCEICPGASLAEPEKEIRFGGIISTCEDFSDDLNALAVDYGLSAEEGCSIVRPDMADNCVCSVQPSASGDPHFTTWSGKQYDFHGVCDLVLLQNPTFENGVGLDIHIRTKQIKQFSYIASAALRIGHETFEVMGDNKENLFWINKQEGRKVDSGIVGLISGYPITSKKLNSKQREYVVELNGPSIVIKTFKKFVFVGVRDATESTFGLSEGLLGSFGSGDLVFRDNSTVTEDMNAFGQDWQVLPSEGMHFHNLEGPQAPEKCEIPQSSNIRRRLFESDVSQEEAKISCGSVDPDVFEMCVFDVMATGDKDIVGAY